MAKGIPWQGLSKISNEGQPGLPGLPGLNK